MSALRFALAASAALASCAPISASDLDRAEWIARVEHAKRGYESFATRAWERYAARRPDAFGPQQTATPASYAQDATLRPGDLVMTDRGFLVYSGAENGQARFRTLAQWRGASPHRADLIELQKAAEAWQ